MFMSGILHAYRQALWQVLPAGFESRSRAFREAYVQAIDRGKHGDEITLSQNYKKR